MQVQAFGFQRETWYMGLSQHPRTLPEDNLAEPSWESSWLFEFLQMQKRLKGGFLDDILSQVLVSQISGGHGRRHHLKTLNQGLIGRALTGLCSLDQFRKFSHHLSLFKKHSFPNEEVPKRDTKVPTLSGHAPPKPRGWVSAADQTQMPS
jgi:hypothetical protein